MYPNTDVDEAVGIIAEEHEKINNPEGLTTQSIVNALQICQRCNVVQFKNRYYLPCRGTAMGPSHACDLTDIWVGPIAKKHKETCPVHTECFCIYRDDGWEILLNGATDIPAYIEHLKTLHPNLDWETTFGREGAYLDLYLFIENGRIESKVYTGFILGIQSKGS